MSTSNTRLVEPIVMGVPASQFIAETFARNRSIFGAFRMDADGEGGDNQGGEGGNGGQPQPKTLEAVLADLNLTPEQIAGRLEASKKWEQRAKSSDVVDRADYERVVQERDTLKQTHETEQEKAVREAKEAGRTEAQAAAGTAAATALLRMAVRSLKKDITDDDLDEIVEETNLSAFLTEKGVDEEKILRRATRAVGTTAAGNAGPDMGQGNRGTQRVTPGQGGAAEADKRFGKTA